LQWIPEIAKAGGKSYTFHYEAVGASRDPHGFRRDPVLTADNHQEIIDLIHKSNLKAGLAISPDTSSDVITESLGNSADLLLVMTVHPGQGGQKFMPECLEKVKDLRERFPGKNIQVDGGVGPGNVCQCAQAGTSWCCLYTLKSR